MESIFLSHHFDNEIIPVIDSFKRLIESHDLEVVDGHRLEGQQLTDAVAKRIKSVDAMIVILSKREEGKTSDWVLHERSAAFTHKIPFIAIIEEGMNNNGPFQAFEYIHFKPDNLVETLLKVSETIFKWKVRIGEQIEVHLEPDDIVATVRENAGQSDIVKYRFLQKRGIWGDWKDAVVIPKSAGVSLLLDGVTKNSEIQIRVSTNNGTWNSDVVNRNLRILVS
ncbi:MAG: hypothetical protein COA50_11720 [Flavobacteriaceae bacterium]|nr:MAG: hypothetical protein COA50_11720 [Flavobacteriaceae bacterium]